MIRVGTLLFSLHLTLSAWAIDPKCAGYLRKKAKQDLATGIILSVAGHTALLGSFYYFSRPTAEISPQPEIELRAHSGESDYAHAIFVDLPRLETPTPAEPPTVNLEPKPELQPKQEQEQEQKQEPKQESKPEPQPQPKLEPEFEPEPKLALPPSLEESLLNLRADLDRYITYPPVAKRNRITGIVIAGFQISKDGRLTNMRIIESSGYQILDEEVMRALRDKSRTWRYLDHNNLLAQGPFPVIYPVKFELIDEDLTP